MVGRRKNKRRGNPEQKSEWTSGVEIRNGDQKRRKGMASRSGRRVLAGMPKEIGRATCAMEEHMSMRADGIKSRDSNVSFPPVPSDVSLRQLRPGEGKQAAAIATKPRHAGYCYIFYRACKCVKVDDSGQALACRAMLKHICSSPAGWAAHTDGHKFS
eukprot:82214-Pelagomonas_calceolata.AAC.4